MMSVRPSGLDVQRIVPRCPTHSRHAHGVAIPASRWRFACSIRNRTVRTDGGAAILDDMPPSTRAIAFLLEHANQRRDDGLPLPCPCVECVTHRGGIRCTSSLDGTTLIIESAR